MQVQGEVQELTIEDMLTRMFPVMKSLKLKKVKEEQTVF